MTNKAAMDAFMESDKAGPMDVRVGDLVFHNCQVLPDEICDDTVCMPLTFDIEPFKK